jgi:hypothetical protein
MRREKIDDYMSFPFVLNMNNYIKYLFFLLIIAKSGYDGIPNKVSEECDQSYFEDTKPKAQKKTQFSNLPRVAPPPPPPISAAMKKQAKSSSSS